MIPFVHANPFGIYAQSISSVPLSGTGGIALRFLLHHFFRRAGKQDLTAFTTAFGAHVDQVVGAFDDVEVMLDDDDGVAPFPPVCSGHPEGRGCLRNEDRLSVRQYI